MEYKHIKDCWGAIREAKSISELEKLFNEFPRWSGDWSIDLEGTSYVVTNFYYDPATGDSDTDRETLDIPVEVEVDDEDLEDKIPTYQVWTFELDENKDLIEDVLVKEFNTPEAAVAFAKTLALPDTLASTTAFYEIMVETVLDFGDYLENVSTLFHEIFEI